MSGQRRCALCGCFRADRETVAQAEEHVRADIAVAVRVRGAEGLVGLLTNSCVRVDQVAGREHEVVRRLLSVPLRHLDRARIVEAVRRLGGRADLEAIARETCYSALRRKLDRAARDPNSGLKFEKTGRHVVYVADPAPTSSPQPREEGAA